MAQINIIKPNFGTIEVLNPNLSSYTVQFLHDYEDVRFTGFRVFCHACGKYLLTSPDNPSVFNIQDLLNSGHPGPFDISAGVEADVVFEAWVHSMDESMGSVSPAHVSIPCQLGDTVSFTIVATPKPGYRFVKWVSATGSEYTKATATVRYQIKTTSTGARYYAYFEPIPTPRYKVVIIPNVRSVYNVRPEKITSSSATIGLYLDNGVKKYDVATAYGAGVVLGPGETTTLSVVMLPSRQSEEFVSWNFGYDSSTNTTFTVTAPNEQPSEDKELIVYLNISVGERYLLEINFKNKKYGCFTVDAGWFAPMIVQSERPVYPDGTAIEKKIETEGVCYSRIVLSLSSRLASGGLDIRAYRWDYFTDIPEDRKTDTSQKSILHGVTVSSNVDRYDFTVSRLGKNEIDIHVYQPIINPDVTSVISIAACTHMLIHDGTNLLSKPSELLCDCNKNNDGTFYPV